MWLAVNGPLIAAVLVPVRGRPALRWLADLLWFQVGVATGWSVFQSRAAAGAPRPGRASRTCPGC